MTGQWREVAKLKFEGDRFRDHALDLSALTELRQFQKIVAETAKALWRAANPDRERLPAHFEDRTRLCLRRIDSGSAVAPLEVYVEASEQNEMWESEPREVCDAISLAFQVFDAASHGGPLPDALPRELLPDYVEWGRSLGDDATVEFTPSSRTRGVRSTPENRARLEEFIERPQPATVSVQGEVFSADVERQRFQLHREGDRAAIVVSFSPDQERIVTTALRDHGAVRIEVRGIAERSPEGTPTRIVQVDDLRIVPAESLYSYIPGAARIEDTIDSIWSDVPAAEWERLPHDLSDRLDEYLYGTGE